jgi:hypothetical protein
MKHATSHGPEQTPLQIEQIKVKMKWKCKKTIITNIACMIKHIPEVTKVYIHMLTASNVTHNGFLTTTLNNFPCYASTNWLWILDSLKFIYSLESCFEETSPQNFFYSLTLKYSISCIPNSKKEKEKERNLGWHSY